jgi:hypothetical protein
MITNVTQEDVIDYCGTWFESNCVGLVAMFVDPKYISNDLDSKDDGEVNGDEKVIDIGLIGTMEEVLLPIDKIKVIDELESSFGKRTSLFTSHNARNCQRMHTKRVCIL